MRLVTSQSIPGARPVQGAKRKLFTVRCFFCKIIFKETNSHAVDKAIPYRNNLGCLEKARYEDNLKLGEIIHTNYMQDSSNSVDVLQTVIYMGIDNFLVFTPEPYRLPLKI